MTLKNIQLTSVDAVYGLTDKHIDFTTEKAGIHSEMASAFTDLKKAAEHQGITIEIASGFRSFDRQLLIWNNKFTGKAAIKNQQGDIVDITTLSEYDIVQAILLYSALPGASRHHWGCDIDIYAPNFLTNTQHLQLEPWEYEQQGPFAPLSIWLKSHLADYGFYFPYDQFRGGIAAEPWHISYAPLAQQYQQAFDTTILAEQLNKADIAGKSTIIEHLPNIVQQYVLNVNPMS